ncbi:hypothetical protein HK13_13690 [Acetobacter indonesiensis]|uniref:transposase n=1 Tax=Acetobacter indonesiensis TaxID=104101 RepID=UPI000A39FFC9|nr:hypothetical protein HK13_13690 [Acetobacter indonesiensis]
MSVGNVKYSNYHELVSRKCSYLKVASNQKGYGRVKPCRFTEEPIIMLLKKQETELKVSYLCRKHGISDTIFDKWQSDHEMHKVYLEVTGFFVPAWKPA